MLVTAVVLVGGLVICNCIAPLFNGSLYARKSLTEARVEPRCSRYSSDQRPLWLVVSNRCSMVSYAKHPNCWLAWDVLDPLHLIASYCVPPPCLLVVRFGLLLHFAATILADSLTDGNITPAWLLAFDHWVAIMVGATGLLGCVALQWKLPEKCYVLLLSTTAPAAVLAPVLYWPKGSVCATQYALQSVAIALLMLEVVLSRTPLVSYHFQVYMLFCSGYMATVWVHHAVTGTWLYSRLDWSTTSCIVFYAGLLVLLVLSWFTWYVIACIRETLSGACLQDKASAAFITTMTIVPEATAELECVAWTEPSFAMWSNNTDQNKEVIAISGPLHAQLADLPTKRFHHTLAETHA